MKTTIAMVMLVLSLSVTSEAALAKGCLKGAVAGGILGHYAGRHGALGALAGCLYGRHEANKHPYNDYGRRQPSRGWL